MIISPAHSIADWLATHGLEGYAPVFEEHDVDLATLSELTYDHLREMGLPLGACLRICKALADQKAASATPKDVTERRQVTVMFCDIVGSTKLAAKLDPEDMRRFLLGYWQIIEATAAQYQGYIAQHLGDGAMIYFGFPVASETDAERAILAGLALLKSVSEAMSIAKTKLEVRIGLATGTVVINQFTGGTGKVETLAIGQSVNFAARLQTLARPGNLVVDTPTKTLAEGLFLFEDIGPIEVDGFSDPDPLYKVIGARRVRSRFEAQTRGKATTFWGRKTELAQALRGWASCLENRGGMVLVQGEPGIGKSRFVQEIMLTASNSGAENILLQCSAHSSGSPLFPVIESLSLLANTLPSDTSAQILKRLRSLLVATGDTEALLMGLFEQGPVAHANPQLYRNKTLAALVDWFCAKSVAAPLLLVVEDLHLCDPTTLEFLERLLQQGSDQRLMILATARPEFAHDFGRDTTTTIALKRLTRRNTDNLVREIFGAHSVSAQLLDIVAERADGVPLFVEELLKSLAETGAIMTADQSVALNSGIDGSAIPRSLQSILTARLDKLRGAKRIAQIAACIGREFSFDLLQSVANVSTPELRMHLNEIAQSDLIVEAGQTAAEFGFRHALVRDAAYGSLLFSERQSIHGQIADMLATVSPPIRPEILAHHLSHAQRLMPAIQKWSEAGKAAKLRSAEAEAVEHLKRALQVVEKLPASAERDDVELTVLLDLIAPLRAARGFAAADVAALTSRAIALADKVKDARRILPLLYNRWVYNFVTSHRSVCLPLAQDILDRSDFDTTQLLRMTGLRAVAATQFTAGDFRSAAPNFDASIAAYDTVQQAEMIHAVGLDGKVTALGYCALTRWCLGQHDIAHAHARDALVAAKAINHISTTIFAIYHHALLAGVLERNAALLQTNGALLQSLGQDNGLSMWLICGKLLESLGKAIAFPSIADIKTAEGYLSDFADMGLVYRPTYHVLLAEICRAAAQTDRAAGHVESAKTMINLSGERWNEAEVFRLQGLLTSDAAIAGTWFDQAAKIAQRQGAVVWQKRAEQALLRLKAGR